MVTFKKAVFPGKYIQGAGVYKGIPGMMESFGGRGLLLVTPSMRQMIGDNLKPSLPAGSMIEVFSGECCQMEIKRLNKVVQDNNLKVIAGIGGGKTIDTAKIIADNAGLPIIIMPTIASNDAPCSSLSIIYSEQGIFESILYQRSNPDAVLVDTEIIARAPVRFLIAGMGDALSTWFEARSCARNGAMNVCGGRCSLTAIALARLCYDTLLKYGMAAKLACEQNIVTPALERIIEANIMLSGLGFESGGLGAAHSIHNGLTALEPTHAFYHGEKVAFGVLAGLHLNDASPREMHTVYSFCERIGLPTTLADIGLCGVAESELARAADRACAKDESIHHEAGEITPARVLSAMIAADAMGRYRRDQTENMR